MAAGLSGALSAARCRSADSHNTQRMTMNRITVTMLKGLLARMARTTGAPTGPTWTKREDGKGMRATVGALILEQGSATYGNAWTICGLMNEAGGQCVIVRGSTARELWENAQAWLDGYEAAQIATRKRLEGGA